MILTSRKIHHCITKLNRKGGAHLYIDCLLGEKSSEINDYTLNLLEITDQSKFDFLHIHSPQQLLAYRGDCPAVFTLHNHSVYCPSGTKYLARKKSCCNRSVSLLGCVWGTYFDHCGSLRPDRFFSGLELTQHSLKVLESLGIPAITVSDYARDWLIKEGISENQVVTVHHGITVDSEAKNLFSPEVHRQQRILFAGRLVPDKGVDWLLKSLAKTSHTIQLDIAGEGWFEAELKQLAHKLGISHRVKWHGWCNREELANLYRQCFAVVFPSLWPEPAGLVTLEAYSYFRPVIASAVGGIPEYLINGYSGILVEPYQVEGLAVAITTLSKDHQKAYKLGIQGNDLLKEKFTIQQHISKLNKVYEKAIRESEKSKTHH